MLCVFLQEKTGYDFLYGLFFFQAGDSIREPLWSRGLGDVYKRPLRTLAFTAQEQKTISIILILNMKRSTFKKTKMRETFLLNLALELSLKFL